MKTNLGFILLAILSLSIFSSCEEEDRPYGSYDTNATAYVQFFDYNFDFVVNKLNAAGEAANAEGELIVKLLGPPSSSDRTVNFSISDRGVLTDDVGDTVMIPATSAMYSLSSNSFTVKAGETSGHIAITLINLELPLEETVYFDLEISGGDVELAETATNSTVTLFKKDFCPYLKEDLVGDWDVFETTYYGSRVSGPGTYHVSAGEGDTLFFTESFWWNGPARTWGETTTDVGDPIPVVLDATDPINPDVYIPGGHYLMTTDGIYPYWVADMNTAFESSDYDWVFSYCDKTLTMNIGIGYDGDVTYHIDAFQVVLDWSGAKKVAYVNRNPLPHFDYSLPFDK